MRTQNNKTETKDSFVFYRSYFEALSDLPEEQQFKLYFAISNYSLNFIEPKFDGICKTVWTLVKPQIDANRKKWQNGILGAEHGKKGGRPKKENPKGVIFKTPNVNDNENANEKENVNTEKTHSHFFSFTNYKTNYTDLPEPIQTAITKEDWNTWQLFNQYLDSKCKNIRKMQEQINFDGYLEYKARYIKSKLISAERFKLMLSKFNNYQPNQKLSSVYDGLIDWTEREITYLKVV